MLDYYVYAYLRTDNTPYYIGKGKGNRAYEKSTHTVPTPTRDRIIFLETNLTELGAWALERRMIRWYGRKIDGSGILRNTQSGGPRGEAGDGIRAPKTEEHRRKLSEALKGRKPVRTAEQLAEAARRGKEQHHRLHTPEALEKSRQTRLARQHKRTDGSKQKMKDAWTDERRAAQAERTRARNEARRKPKPPKAEPEPLTCPHCGKVGMNRGAMARFHFTNCPRVCIDP